MQRWALLVQYAGTEFAGSQWQPNQPTVQGALEAALLALCPEVAEREPQLRRMTLAGRTDAGVHAAGQVASFLTERPLAVMSGKRWVRGLNHFLPRSVAVQGACAVGLMWDPRRAARERTYEYWLAVSAQRQPLWEGRAWVVGPPLTIWRMRAALGVLAGERDFAAFTPPAQQEGGRSTVRTMREASIWSEAGGLGTIHGGLVRLRFRADSFVQHQVRRMTGAAVAVGQGRLGLAEWQHNVEAAHPGTMGPTAPPEGLTLAAVAYEPPLLWEPAGSALSSGSGAGLPLAVSSAEPEEAAGAGEEQER